MKYLKYFETEEEYTAYKNGSDYSSWMSTDDYLGKYNWTINYI